METETRTTSLYLTELFLHVYTVVLVESLCIRVMSEYFHLRPDGSDPPLSEGALQQAVAAAAGRTLVLLAEPVHHVTGVSSVTTAQTEVGGAAYGHVTDGALEGETLTDGTLSAASLTATVTAVHAELDAFVRFRRAGRELEHVGSFLPQTPAVQDFTVTLLEVIKLQHVGGVQQSLVHVVLLSLSLPWICVTLVAIAIVVRRGLTPGAGVLRVSPCVPGGCGDGVGGAGA